MLVFLNKYKMFTDWLEIEDGSWKEVNFSGTVIISNGFDSDKVLSNINTAINSLLNIDIKEMGEPLRISDVYHALDNIEGVEYSELISPSATVTANKNELLVVGNINLTLKFKGDVEDGQNI